MGPTSQSKRLPVSCEPCRKRKIRCARNRPPCDTCLRRGLGPADCIYLGQPRHGVGQLNGDISNVAQEELFQRIRNLEDLLLKHVSKDVLAQQQDGPSTPPWSNSTTAAGSCSPASSSNNNNNNSNKKIIGSDVSDRQDQFLYPSPPDPIAQVVEDVGSLSISSSGHVRYEPKSAVINSQVAQQSSQDYADELRSNNNEDEDLCGFPFAWENPPNRSELLGRLPPGRYCDTLKDVYFRVFSPVCLSLSLFLSSILSSISISFFLFFSSFFFAYLHVWFLVISCPPRPNLRTRIPPIQRRPEQCVSFVARASLRSPSYRRQRARR